MHLDLLKGNFTKIKDQKNLIKLSIEKISENVEKKL